MVRATFATLVGFAPLRVSLGGVQKERPDMAEFTTLQEMLLIAHGKLESRRVGFHQRRHRVGDDAAAQSARASTGSRSVRAC